MNNLKQKHDDLEYLTFQEDIHLDLRDTHKTGSEDYLYYQRLFGIYFRARIRCQRDIDGMKGNAIPDKLD